MYKAILAVAVIFAASGASAQSNNCGSSAQANVVFMLDVSQSMNSDLIALQKSIARDLVLQFSGSFLRPLVSVGTYNTLCGSFESCIPAPVIPESRIYTLLSDNYSQALAFLSPVGGIVGQGYYGNGLGGTNISKGLQASRLELAAHGNPFYQNYVVLFSDGDADFPGLFQDPYSICNEYSCPRAESQATIEASSLRSLGWKVITIHIGQSLYGGPQFLSNSIAFNQFYSFEAPSLNPTNVAGLIGEQVVCNDGRSCTLDYCDQVTHHCSFIELDQDHDGVPDCHDLCQGNNSLVGQPCDGGDADSCAGGVYVCNNGIVSCTDDVAIDDRDHDGIPDCLDGCPNDFNKTQPGACGCGTPDLDTNHDGIIDCTVISNSGCSSRDISSVSESLINATGAQQSQMSRLLSELSIRQSQCPKPLKVGAFVNAAGTASSKALAANTLQSSIVPTQVLDCPLTSGCIQDAAVGFNAVPFIANSAVLKRLSIQAINFVLGCRTAASPCVDSKAECALRRRLRISAAKADKQLSTRLHAINVAAAKSVPRTTDHCGQ